MSILSEISIMLAIWVVITLSVCLPLCNYIIDKTNREELAYLVYPIWLILSILGLGIYLN